MQNTIIISADIVYLHVRMTPIQNGWYVQFRSLNYVQCVFKINVSASVQCIYQTHLSLNPPICSSVYTWSEQVYCTGQWGVVCGDIGQEEADKVCRQLGYTGADRFGFKLRWVWYQPFWIGVILTCKYTISALIIMVFCIYTEHWHSH